MLRRVEAQRIVLWLATSAPMRARIDLDLGGDQPLRLEPAPGTPACRVLTAGEHLHYLLLDLALDTELPAGRWIGYRLALAPRDEVEPQWRAAADWAPDLC